MAIGSARSWSATAAQIANGRTYLREMVFGDPEEPRHRDALMITARTEAAIAAILGERLGLDAAAPATLAQVISAILFLTMAASEYVDSNVEQIVDVIRSQVAAILPH